METAKISIIIPIYNNCTQSVKLIKQLLDDKYRNTEIIAVDDGSTDNVLEQLRQIKNKRLKVLHQINQGPSAARNAGLLCATGKYIIFIDSDDLISPDFITKMAKAAREAPIASCAILYNSENSSQKLYTSIPTPQSSDETFAAYILRLLITDGRLYGVFGNIFV